MTPRQTAELLALAALWGASFLFMRLGAQAFGPAALVFVRVGLAAALLLPWLVLTGGVVALRERWRDIALVGAVNSTGPFLLFAVASLVLAAGTMAVLNATAPLWTALLAYGVWRERLDASRVAGLGLGFVGVLGLTWDAMGVRGGDAFRIALALLACLARRRLAGAPPMAVAAGSQAASASLLAAPAAALWPAAAPSPTAWAAAIGLAVACTALAYVLYFRLIAQVGATKAIAVTYLVPAFAMVWGALVLGERPTAPMLVATAVILLGTALATGVLRLPRARLT
jgi:drug/metabolite transporter (DMT)-like permease